MIYEGYSYNWYIYLLVFLILEGCGGENLIGSRVIIYIRLFEDIWY